MGGAIIYAAIVVVWAIVLVPRWLRKHDAPAEPEPADEPAGRVLSRRTRAPGEPPSTSEPPVESAAESAARSRRRDSAARARRTVVRHRLVFCGLLLATAGCIAGVHNDLLPWWSVCAPALLLPAYLVHVRRVIVAEHLRRRRTAMVPLARAADAGSGATPLADHRRKVAPGMRVLDRGTLFDQHATEPWMPQPVPLPTYLTAPAARSGYEPAASVEEYDEATAPAEDAPAYPIRRAVGD